MTYFIYILLLLFLHLTFLINLQFTAWPEMFSYPYLLNHGFRLYQDIALPYEPLLPVILSWVYKIFGYELLTLKLFTWVLILISDLLIFYISYKLIGKKLISILPLSLYIIIQPLADGNLLWFDLASVPFILTGLAIFFLDKKKKFFFLGLFLALAFFIKQQIALAFLILIIYLLLTKQVRNLAHFIFGLMIPIFLIFLYVIFFSNIEDWFFWTKIVPVFWYPKFSGYTKWPETFEIIKLLLLFGPALFLGLKGWKASDNLRVTILIFLALFVTSFPRFEFFRLQQTIAVLVILIAMLIGTFKFKVFLLNFGIILFVFVSLGGTLRNISLPARFYEPWKIEKTKSLQTFISPLDKVYFLGLESSNYALLNVLPPKPWVDNFVWYMEISGVQEKVIKGFKSSPPNVIFWREPDTGKWYDLGTYQPGKIVEYIKLNYEKIEGIGEIEVWKKR